MSEIRKTQIDYIIDGTNILYLQSNSSVLGTSEKSPPNGNNKALSMRLLLALLIQLREREQDFICIFDGNTYHRLVREEREFYVRLKEFKKYFVEIVGGTDADKFIVDYADTEKCHIISNDSFKEFHDDYKWLNKFNNRIIKAHIIRERLLVPDVKITIQLADIQPKKMSDLSNELITLMENKKKYSKGRREKGKIKLFDRKKQYGFIIPKEDGMEEAYFNLPNLVENKAIDIDKNIKVEYEVMLNKDEKDEKKNRPSVTRIRLFGSKNGHEEHSARGRRRQKPTNAGEDSSKIASLKRKVSDLEKALADKNKIIDKQEQTIQCIEKELAKSVKEMTKRQLANKALAAQAPTEIQKYLSSDEELTECNATVQRLEEKLTNKDKTLTDLQQVLADQQVTIEKLKDEKDKYRKRTTNLQEDVNNYQKEIAASEQLLKEKERALLITSKELEHTKGELNTALNWFAEIAKKLNKLTANIDRERPRLEGEE